jgi:alanyl-tRNA synthetase
VGGFWEPSCGTAGPPSEVFFQKSPKLRKLKPVEQRYTESTVL